MQITARCQGGQPASLVVNEVAQAVIDRLLVWLGLCRTGSTARPKSLLEFCFSLVGVADADRHRNPWPYPPFPAQAPLTVRTTSLGSSQEQIEKKDSNGFSSVHVFTQPGPKAPFGVQAHPVTTAGPCSVKRARKTHTEQKSKFDAGIIGNSSTRASTASSCSCPPPISYSNRSRHDLNDPASNWLIEKRALRLQEVSDLHQQLMH